MGVSRRLEDRERERLRRQTSGLPLEAGGVIVRTAAHGAKRADFDRELKYLHKLHEVLEKRVKDTPAPDLVFQEADLSVRVVRDIFSAHFERALVDDEQQLFRPRRVHPQIKNVARLVALIAGADFLREYLG